MKNNITATNKNTKQALTKSKNLMNLADKILAKKDFKVLDTDESWMQRLWDLADEKQISETILPRNKNDLIDLTKLCTGFHFFENIITEIPIEIDSLIKGRKWV